MTGASAPIRAQTAEEQKARESEQEANSIWIVPVISCYYRIEHDGFLQDVPISLVLLRIS